MRIFFFGALGEKKERKKVSLEASCIESVHKVGVAAASGGRETAQGEQLAFTAATAAVFGGAMPSKSSCYGMCVPFP